MLTRLTKIIEFAANVAIIVVAVVLATALIKTYLTKHATPPSDDPSAVTSSPNVSSLQVDWRQSRQTLVLAISATCHFCTESGTFYKTLVANKGDTRIVAVLPQTVDEGRKYLEKLGVETDEVKQLPLDKIGVQGTPSLLLVNTSGAVTNFWQGKLETDRERAVLSAIGK